MQAFRRPRGPSHRPKVMTSLGGGFYRGQPQEDEEHLLEREEEKEPHLPFNYYNQISFQNEDYERKAVYFESYCRKLEARLVEVHEQQLDMQRSLREQNKQREAEDKEIIDVMKIMKDYIHQLEHDNDVLLAESKSSISHGSGASAIQPKSRERKFIRSKVGADWSVVSNLASKISEAKKENLKLKEIMLTKGRETEHVLVLTSGLRAKLERTQYEKEQLATKCEILEEAVAALTEEIKIYKWPQRNKGTKLPTIIDQKNFANTRKETNTNPTAQLLQVQNFQSHSRELMNRIEIQKHTWQESMSGKEDESVSMDSTMAGSQDELDEILSDTGFTHERPSQIQTSQKTKGTQKIKKTSYSNSLERIVENFNENMDEHLTTKRSTLSAKSSTNTVNECHEQLDDRRDELGPRPIHRGSSFRESGIIGRDTSFSNPSASLELMHNNPHRGPLRGNDRQEHFVSTISAMQHNGYDHRNDGLRQSDDDISEKTAKARIKVLDNMNKKITWRDDVVGRFLRNEGPDRLQGDFQRSNSQKRVWA